MPPCATEALPLLVTPAAKYVGIGGRSMEIKEGMAMRCHLAACAVQKSTWTPDTRHSCICPRADEQVNQLPAASPRDLPLAQATWDSSPNPKRGGLSRRTGA